MHFLFSGEGVTDFGTCDHAADHCQGEAYLHGPMAVIVDQLVEQHHRYSPLDTEVCLYATEHWLADRASELKAVKKAL